jgi:hypothetical protein
VSRPNAANTPLVGPFEFVEAVVSRAVASTAGNATAPPPRPPPPPRLPPPMPKPPGTGTGGPLADAIAALARTFLGPPGLPLEIFDVDGREEPAAVCDRLRAANPGERGGVEVRGAGGGAG